MDAKKDSEKIYLCKHKTYSKNDKDMRHKLLFFICSLLLTCYFPLTAQVNEKPFVIPELKEWNGSTGKLLMKKKPTIITSSQNPQLVNVAKTFATDYHTMFGEKPSIKNKKPETGNIIFTLSSENDLGKEGYTIQIDDRITITAQSSTGAFWATRTLLQMLEQSNDNTLPKGFIKDIPQYEKRGFMLDCARKFFPLGFLQDYVKFMSYYKMNTFQIHLNDNGFKQFFGNDWAKTYAAFRLESTTFPGLTAKDGSYTKQEFIDLQKLAEEYNIEIIPEIDVPAHSLAFTQYRPEIGSQEYGMDHLDLFKPQTYSFLDSLFTEYLSGDNPVFRGKSVHIGTDEYSNKKKDVVEKFRYFTDYYIRFVEKFGKQAYIWGALTHAKGETPVKSENVIMNAWYNGYADPKEMVKQGYKLISIPDGLLYIVPAAGYYYDYLNTEYLYKNWTPSLIGNVKFEENDPMITGGMFAVWNDHAGNGISTGDVHHRVLPAMQTLAAKMWNGKDVTTSFETFNEKRHRISEAPGVNRAGKIGNRKGLVYEKEKIKPNGHTPYTQIGYDYTVEFDITCKDSEPGIILFKSPESIFYLTDPKEGKLGFARDNYLNTFNYRLPAQEKVHIRISGNSVSTQLFVNGTLIENLDIQKKTFNDGKDKMSYVRTLVFPLQQTGNFKSKIENLKVYNYVR